MKKIIYAALVLWACGTSHCCEIEEKKEKKIDVCEQIKTLTPEDKRVFW